MNFVQSWRQPERRALEGGDIATDNAVSSLMKLAKYRADVCANAWPLILSWLPLCADGNGDYLEALEAHKFFVHEVESQNPHVTASNETRRILNSLLSCDCSAEDAILDSSTAAYYRLPRSNSKVQVHIN